MNKDTLRTPPPEACKVSSELVKRFERRSVGGSGLIERLPLGLRRGSLRSPRVNELPEAVP